MALCIQQSEWVLQPGLINSPRWRNSKVIYKLFLLLCSPEEGLLSMLNVGNQRKESLLQEHKLPVQMHLGAAPNTSDGHGVLRKGQHRREYGISHIHPVAGWAMSRFLVEVCYMREEFCSALLSLLQTQRSAWGLEANEEDLRGMDPLSESCTRFPVGDKDRIPPGHSHQWHQVLPLSSALLSCCSSVWPSQAVSQMHCSELSHQQHHAGRTGWTTDVPAPSISLKTQRQPLKGARRKMPKSSTGNNSLKPTAPKKNFKLTAWYLFTWNCLLSPAGNWIILLV